MNPIQLLKQDHRNVKSLFRRFARADRESERQKLGEEIIQELSIHAAIEEQLVYPLLRGRKGEQAVLNALEEHHAVKLVLAELDRADASHERYGAKMHVVRDSVEMHIEEEEAELLPLLEKMLDREDRKRLAELILEMKQSAPSHPHPSAPDTPPLAAVAGMIAKIADSGRDAVRRLTSTDRAAGQRQVKRRAQRAAKPRGRVRRRRSSTRSRSRTRVARAK